MPDETPGFNEKNDMMEFADKKETDFSSVFVWIGFVLALLFLGYIVFANMSLTKEITQKQNEKAEADATLNLPENLKVESDVLGVQNVISTLSSVTTGQDTKSESLEKLYGYITKDVKISALSLTADGTVGLDGSTATYRDVSDLMLSLKSYKKVSDLSLKSASLSNIVGVAANVRVAFSLSFKLNMTKDAATASPTSTSTTTDNTAASGTSGSSATSSDTNP